MARPDERMTWVATRHLVLAHPDLPRHYQVAKGTRVGFSVLIDDPAEAARFVRIRRYLDRHSGLVRMPELVGVAVA